MRDRPILFSGAMVRAILDGTKTQTRRAYKNRKHPDFGCDIAAGELVRERQDVIDRACPYGQPGDRLWVRETTIKVEEHGYAGPVYVESEHGRSVIEYGLGPEDDYIEVEPHDIRKRPAIHMPRSMSRITLEITGVRVERLNDISETDAIMEGCALECMRPDGTDNGSAIYGPGGYIALWESINGPDSWAANPWVWVVEFRQFSTRAA